MYVVASKISTCVTGDKTSQKSETERNIQKIKLSRTK